ncbi:ribonuclease HII [Bacillus salitolerans]|uniref:Ribonuclease HII n=1 Tax=Bacillus salitolerans TaxID=1437434 RepID=A0ABW4LL65_9BACI
MNKNYTIEEIGEILSKSEVDKNILRDLYKDKRKGVLKLLEKWEKKQMLLKQLQGQLTAMSVYEKEYKNQGYEFIAGVDEVGRGPLAGPVVAAAVILPEGFSVLGINDSKQLSEEKREYLFDQIQASAISIGIGIIPAKQIDEINIYEATKRAMLKAINMLQVKPHYLLIDAMKLPINIPQLSLVKGDQKSISIAASSIIAKVTRDRYMKRMGEAYPEYGFEKHMGYGTKQHIEAISMHGIIGEHRRTFSPIREEVKEAKG